MFFFVSYKLTNELISENIRKYCPW